MTAAMPATIHVSGFVNNAALKASIFGIIPIIVLPSEPKNKAVLPIGKSRKLNAEASAPVIPTTAVKPTAIFINVPVSSGLALTQFFTFSVISPNFVDNCFNCGAMVAPISASKFVKVPVVASQILVSVPNCSFTRLRKSACFSIFAANSSYPAFPFSRRVNTT